jgi:hypothetical protein
MTAADRAKANDAGNFLRGKRTGSFIFNITLSGYPCFVREGKTVTFSASRLRHGTVSHIGGSGGKAVVTAHRAP